MSFGRIFGSESECRGVELMEKRERQKAAKARHAARMKAEGRRQIHLWVKDEGSIPVEGENVR